jgi:hypothetical protein
VCFVQESFRRAAVLQAQHEERAAAAEKLAGELAGQLQELRAQMTQLQEHEAARTLVAVADTLHAVNGSSSSSSSSSSHEARVLWATLPFSLDALRGEAGVAADPLFEYCMANPNVDMEECRIFHAKLNEKRNSTTGEQEVPPMMSI